MMLRALERPISGDSEQDIDIAAREDLVKLKRAYRIREENRKQYYDHTSHCLKRQQDMIDVLKAENADLVKNLHLAGSKQNEIKDRRITSKLEELLLKQELYNAAISDDEKVIDDLDAAIREMETMVDKQRKNVGGALMAQSRVGYFQQQYTVKENRLDKEFVRFNRSLTTNSKLRSMIDHLRQERHVFEGKYKKLQQELIDYKKAIGHITEVSTQAYESRDDSQNRMTALKDKAEKELTHYTMELKELIRVIDHDRKLKLFMSHKEQERTEAHEEIAAMKRKKENEKSNDREKTVMSYEQAFEQIKEATGITDIDQLVTKFIEVEDQNFALFNYVNELNGEIEIVQEQIQHIHADIEQFKSQGVEMEKKRKNILSGLEKELEGIIDEAASQDSRYSAASKILDQLKSGIESVFSKIGCDVTTITDMLGGHAGVTDSTILQYLGIVEQKTNQILQLQVFIHAKKTDDPDALSRHLTGTVRSFATSSFLLPNTLEEHVVDNEADDEGKPLTIDDLRARAMKEMGKKAAGSDSKTIHIGTAPSMPTSRRTLKLSSAERKKRSISAR